MDVIQSNADDVVGQMALWHDVVKRCGHGVVVMKSRCGHHDVNMHLVMMWPYDVVI